MTLAASWVTLAVSHLPVALGPSVAVDVVAYLEAVIEEGGDDPTAITQALGAIARSRNLSDIARRAGMSREGLYKALSATGNPSFATVVKVSRALGMRIHFEAIA